MSVYIDVLQPTLADCPTFTVNTAVDSVNLSAGLNDYKILKIYTIALQDVGVFQAGDNFNILSCGIIVQGDFQLTYLSGVNAYTPVMSIISSNAGAGGGTSIIGFGTNGVLKIPNLNYEVATGNYINIVSQRTGKFNLKVSMEYVSINMIGLPAAFNGKIFKVIPFIKIQHNLALVAA